MPGPEKREGDDEASNCAESTLAPPPPSRNGGIAAAVVAKVAAGRIGAPVVRGRWRGFAEFSEQAQVLGLRNTSIYVDCLLTVGVSTITRSQVIVATLGQRCSIGVISCCGDELLLWLLLGVKGNVSALWWFLVG